MLFCNSSHPICAREKKVIMLPIEYKEWISNSSLLHDSSGELGSSDCMITGNCSYLHSEIDNRRRRNKISETFLVTIKWKLEILTSSYPVGVRVAYMSAWVACIADALILSSPEPDQDRQQLPVSENRSCSRKSGLCAQTHLKEDSMVKIMASEIVLRTKIRKRWQFYPKNGVLK